MMTKIRHYNAYISWLYRLIVLTVIPVALALLFLLLAGNGGEVGVMTCLLMLPAALLLLFLIADRLIIGPVYETGHTEADFLKSSERGRQVFADVMKMDVCLRLVIYSAVFVIGAILLGVSGRHAGYLEQIWCAVLVDIVALHAATQVGLLIIRRIQNPNLYVLFIYVAELLLLPAFAAVVVGSVPVAMSVGVLYLAADVAATVGNTNIVKKMTAGKWYSDVQNGRSVAE